MEKYFSAIRQNEKLRVRLANEIADGRFPHAYILAGPKGSGKHTIALNIAAALACNNKHQLPCGVCDSCRKILGGFSPDVIFIKKEEDKKEFSVSLIREIKENLYIAPNELEKRVYILEDCELMNQSAQNAFLKMLEEPPSYVVFLLLCTNTENLLETVKSRAPVLCTEPVSNEEILSYLLENSPAARQMQSSDADKLSGIINSAGGSIGLAYSVCEDSEKYGETRRITDEYLDALIAPTHLQLELFCDMLPGNADGISAFLVMLKKALRDIAVYKSDENCNLMYFESPEKADRYASRITVSKLIALVDACDVLSEKFKFYIDPRLAAVTFCGDSKRIISK